MNSLYLIAPLTLAIVACEIFFPGHDLYHKGWFNVALAALVVAGIVAARAPFRAAAGVRARVGIAAIACGTAIAGFAGVTSGLLAPDNRTVVGAPGANVVVDDLGGTLSFPLKVSKDGGNQEVLLVRDGRATPIGTSPRDVGSFVLRQIPRDVVSVEATDRHGASLTVTQPSGTTFLSPVLMMEQRQKIPQTNLNVPFDAFAVPAAHRNVKAVLFTPQQAAMLHPAAGRQTAEVLFAVDDEDDRPIPNAIAMAQDGDTVDVGGLRLRAALFSYPAIEYIAVVAGFIATRLDAPGSHAQRSVSEATV
jgi:hypothetical protein